MITEIYTILREILNWREFLDISLITLVFFFAYRTLRRLGSWRTVTGVALVMVVFTLASLLDLKGIKWTYTNLSDIALIALIIIFQPELRKVFEKAASFARNNSKKENSNLTALITEVLFSLAQQHWGAIIVFPGKDSLKQHLSGGSSLNAEPSFPLLMSIFDPHSPGHDGAIIIDNGKLLSFGNRLPLSQTNSLSAIFGTRHNAAMGLCELTDALVIAVSEERGTITGFHNGTFEKLADKDALDAAIRNHWANTASYTLSPAKGKSRWSLIPEIGISIVLTFIFWSSIIIAQGEILERVFTVPIEYVGTPANIALVGSKPTDIRVHLKGQKSDINSINPAHMVAKLNLAGAMPGKQTFVINEDNIHLPKGVTLMETQPAGLTLSLQEIVQKDIPIKPQFIGKLPGQLVMFKLEFNPPLITAFVPAEEDKQKTMNLLTTPIYLENIEEDTKLFCKIIAPPSVQPVDKRWPDVEVFIDVESRQ